MKLVGLVVLGLMVHSGQAQRDCNRPEMSQRQLSRWMQQAHSQEELKVVSCYVRTQANRYEAMAAKEEIELHYAYEHHIGGPKHPSVAEHAKTFLALYKERAHKYSSLARELDARAADDAPTS